MDHVDLLTLVQIVSHNEIFHQNFSPNAIKTTIYFQEKYVQLLFYFSQFYWDTNDIHIV